MAQNMGYCRFRNTAEALDECLEALREEDIETREDRFAAKKMFRAFLRFYYQFGIIDEFDDAQLEKFIDSCYIEEMKNNLFSALAWKTTDFVPGRGGKSMIDNHTPGMILSSQEAIIMARITISIPEDLLGFIDSFATERKLNRSNAVAELVRKARKRDLEAELERGYKEMADMNLQEARQAFSIQAEVVLCDKTR